MQRPGVQLLDEVPGVGDPVCRHKFYYVRLRMWLSGGDPVRWSELWGLYDRGRLDDGGAAMVTSLRVDREYMFPGLFYGVEGMRVGGIRRLRIAPHLAYGEVGVPSVIPANALLTVEVEILAERVD